LQLACRGRKAIGGAVAGALAAGRAVHVADAEILEMAALIV
jgi:hypothetical protein